MVVFSYLIELSAIEGRGAEKGELTPKLGTLTSAMR